MNNELLQKKKRENMPFITQKIHKIVRHKLKDLYNIN